MRSDFPAPRHTILVPRPDVGFWEILDSDSLTQQISLPQKPRMRRWEEPPGFAGPSLWKAVHPCGRPGSQMLLWGVGGDRNAPKIPLLPIPPS